MNTMLVGLRAMRIIFAVYATTLLLLVACNAYHPLTLCTLAEYVAARLLSHAEPTLVAVALIALSSAVCTTILSILIRGAKYLAAKRPVSQ